MEGFYEKIKNPDNKGAVFLAVCRGKVFESFLFVVSIGEVRTDS